VEDSTAEKRAAGSVGPPQPSLQQSPARAAAGCRITAGASAAASLPPPALKDKMVVENKFIEEEKETVCVAQHCQRQKAGLEMHTLEAKHAGEEFEQNELMDNQTVLYMVEMGLKEHNALCQDRTGLDDI
jgi:hypothetical protein